MSNEAPTDALRLAPRRAVYDWLRDDVPLNVKMTVMPHHIDALMDRLSKAAPASPLPGGGWQDVSTAPKDGTEVLVMLRPKVVRLGWYFKPSSRTEGWCDENGKRIIPSHWMPLPAAPTGDA